jgi:hypothetical protein
LNVSDKNDLDFENNQNEKVQEWLETNNFQNNENIQVKTTTTTFSTGKIVKSKINLNQNEETNNITDTKIESETIFYIFSLFLLFSIKINLSAYKTLS